MNGVNTMSTVESVAANYIITDSMEKSSAVWQTHAAFSWFQPALEEAFQSGCFFFEFSLYN